MDNLNTTQAPDIDTRTPAQMQLAELRARRAQVEDEIQARLTPSESDELAAEMRGIEDAEAVAKALAAGEKMGRTIEVLKTSIGWVIVKRCTAMKYRKFQDAGKFDSEDFEKLVRPQVIHPSLDVFDRMLIEQPMLVFVLGNALGRLAGIRKEDVEKK